MYKVEKQPESGQFVAVWKANGKVWGGTFGYDDKGKIIELNGSSKPVDAAILHGFEGNVGIISQGFENRSSTDVKFYVSERREGDRRSS